MANSIQLFVQNAADLLDQVYKKESTTADLDIDGKLVKAGANANEIIVPVLSMDGLADYDRNSGYIDGDVNLVNETVQYNYERGRKLKTDAIDNEETDGVIVANLSNEFLRTKVIPEVDAVRYATYASKEGITNVAPEGVEYQTGQAVLKALESAMTQMDDDEVPEEGRILRITSHLLSLAQFVARTENNDILTKFAQIKKVPQSRFLTKIELNSGKDSDGERIGGYKPVKTKYKLTSDVSLNSSKTYYTRSGSEGAYIYTKVTSPDADNIATYYEMTEEGSREINFMIFHKTAMMQHTKHKKMKMFTPEQDQDGDNYKFLYRIYGLNDIYKNKTAGVVVSYKPLKN